MKYLSLILQSAIVVALGVLFYLHFHHVKNCKTPSAVALPTQKIDSAMKSKPFRIGYVNTDSILTKYEYYKVLNKELENYQSYVEKQIVDKETELTEKYKKLETKINLGIIKKEEALEADARLKEEYETFRTKLRDTYLEKEQKLNMQLYDSVLAYINRYNRTAGFAYILAYAKGGGILHADNAFNLTDAVLKGLNDEYLIHKGKKK